jgi:hypothetical protein
MFVGISEPNSTTCFKAARPLSFMCTTEHMYSSNTEITVSGLRTHHLISYPSFSILQFSQREKYGGAKPELMWLSHRLQSHLMLYSL